jgi:META domain
MRVSSLAAGVAVLASCLTACTASNPHHGTVKHAANSDPGSPTIVHTNPLGLVGSWKVQAAGEPPGVSIILGDEFTVFRACGDVNGEWLADRAGHFISYADSADGRCFRNTHSISVPWLNQATGYRVDGRKRLLLNASGRVLARLSPGAHPTASRHDEASVAATPKVTRTLRTRLATPPRLPAGLRPATPATLVGRWDAIGAHSSDSSGYVQFDPSGRWTGSDGCNGAGGRYAVAAAGQLTITDGGLNGLVECDGSQAMYWAEQARRAGFDGSRLVLINRHGKVLGHLMRSAASH